MGQVLNLVTGIDTRTKDHTVILDNLNKRLAEPVERIAENTKTMADTLRDFRQDNHELTGIVVGKRQVPMTVFLVVIGLVGFAWLFDRATRGLRIELSPISGIQFHYESESKRSNN